MVSAAECSAGMVGEANYQAFILENGRYLGSTVLIWFLFFPFTRLLLLGKSPPSKYSNYSGYSRKAKNN
ncbi:hypothetical protein GCM10010913_48660 [Paenibacillus aceti]|uniref:Uncharacterized protein n=2 Tax=Paenibacillus aceti TaxID=1820010 RepID=A0ABQ1WAT6_9BACL|nr:hypothetical protein GCM10010913_48660 [Paenibacillus aceti]